MTSPLRRKRRTTRRNTNPRNLTSAAVAALGCWVALASSLTGAGELQWRPAKIATPAAATQAAEASAGWSAADQASPSAVTSPVAPEGPRSVVVRRDGERVAQAPDPFDPFDAEMPSTDPVSTPAAPQPDYDPFDEPETAAPAQPTSPNSFPAPSLEEAFEEPAVEEPAAEPPAEEAPAVEPQPNAAQQLEQARQSIDREMMRRETERGLDHELVAPNATPEGEVAPPVVEDHADDIAEEIVAPQTIDADEPESIVEETQEYQLPQNDDSALQYGAELEPLPPPTPEQLELRRQQVEKERLKSLADCEKLYDEVRNDSIKDISLDIRQQGLPGEDFPFECEGRQPTFQPRNWAPVTYMWKASGLCHKPLYFEQVQLERYGHDWGPVLQPIMSGAHFFGSIPILPYKMGLQTPNECDYSLGYYRPGSCAPYMIEPLGFTWRAAAFQAGAVTGAAFAIP